MAVLAMQRALGLTHGFEIEVVKGIPLGSGLGGSAASAVAAVVAAAALVEEPLDKTRLLQFAMQGEKVASGSVHVDNIAPSLFGGLVLTVGIDNPHVKRIPVPESVRCVLVHPHMVLATREARAILKKTVDLSDVIWQQANLAGFLAGCYSSDLPLIRESLLDVIIEPQRQVLIPGFADVKQAALADVIWQQANLAGFLAGCYTGDLPLIRESLLDVVIEPQRQALIPGFAAVKQAAMAAGALGCSISGAGPTVFAWTEAPAAEAVCAGMVAAFRRHGLESDSWVSTIDAAGARVVDG
jgi:homoserine kinase